MKRVATALASAVFLSSLLLLVPRIAPASPPEGHETSQSCCDVHWGYSGPDGPEHWADLSPCYAACKDGGEQSPTELTHSVFANLPKLEPHYARKVTVGVVNNGHTVQAAVPAGSTLAIGDNKFELQQLHFHAKSEHRLDDKPAPMEMHLVHKGAGGRAAVVGVLIVEGPANPELEKIWKQLDQYGRTPTPVADVDIMALLPGDYKSFRYGGSLTTPVCGQGVQWNVLKTPIKASADQIARFAKLFAPAGNARPLQPLNGRTVERDFQ